MLILILIDVQYLWNVVFSFEKGLIQQNHCSSVSHHPLTHPPSNISYSPPPHPLLVSGKPRSVGPSLAASLENFYFSSLSGGKADNVSGISLFYLQYICRAIVFSIIWKHFALIFAGNNYWNIKNTLQNFSATFWVYISSILWSTTHQHFPPSAMDSWNKNATSDGWDSTKGSQTKQN